MALIFFLKTSLGDKPFLFVFLNSEHLKEVRKRKGAGGSEEDVKMS